MTQVRAVPAEPATSGAPHSVKAVDRSAIRRPRLIGELVVVLILLKFYDLVRGHAEVRQAAALTHGRQLLDAERDLHIDLEHAVNIWFTQHNPLSLAASYWYQFAHITVTLCVLVWIWSKRPESYRRARNALVLTNVFGLAAFLLYPAAPPRFLPGQGFVDAVARAGFGTSHGGPVTADLYGAFPSLHLAWATWTAVVMFRLVRRPVLRRLWLGYPLITATVVVATGNHYLLDAIAGWSLALLTLAIAHRYPRSRDYGRRTVRSMGPLRLRLHRLNPMPRLDAALLDLRLRLGWPTLRLRLVALFSKG